MSRIRRALALSLLVACTPATSSSPAPPEAEAVDAPTVQPDGDAAPAESPQPPESEAEAESEAKSDHGHGVLHQDLNAPYAEETNVRKWKARFEREDREVAEHRDEIVAQIGLKPGMAVADIGAGTGLFTFALAEAVGRTGTVIAVDVQDYFLEHVRATAARKKLPQVQTVAATQRSPNLPAGSIDAAFFCDAYHHIEHPAPYLADVHAALRPGGRLVIVDYAKSESAKPFIREHLRATPQEFRAEIEAAGFRFEREWDGLEENFLFVFRKAP
jgi:predicted methyltransferase